MKKISLYKFVILFIVLTCARAVLASGAGGSIPPSDVNKPPSEAMKIIEKMEFKPVQFEIPRVGKEVERVELPNGMILYLMEDHRFPVVKIKGVIRTGEAYEKKEKFGIANLTGVVMRTGGTRDYPPEKLNEELEFLATELETSIGEEMGTISLTCLTSNLDKSLDLFSRVLRYPRFDPEEFELAKMQVKEALRRRNDDPGRIGNKEFYKRVYADYCHGWEYDWDFIKTITRKDLIKWHKRFYHPNNMMFAVVGDFDKDEMVSRFKKIFGDWKKSEVDFSGLQKPARKYHPGLFYVEKDVNQSYIRMGHLGVKRDNPDRYAIEVMNYILGYGGFKSYITEKIRSDEGLAYSVFTYFNLSGRTYGTFGAICSTKSETTVRAAKLMLEQIKRIQNEKVTQKKLEWAKDSIINSFLFEFEKPFEQVIKLMLLEYNRMPRDFYQKYC